MNELNRRSFFKLGVIGTIGLGLVRLASGPFFKNEDTKYHFLEQSDLEFFGAIAKGVLPVQAINDQQSKRFFQSLDFFCSRLSPQQQGEIRQLLTAVRFPILRGLVFGNWKSWEKLNPQEAGKVITKWKTSSQVPLQDAYQGTVSIMLSSWYDLEENWESVGYPGPPEV